MCGIAGLFSFRGSLEEIKRRLSEGSRYLKHRGPDDEGFWIRSQLNGGLAHRRLSILDLSPAGHQPMTDSSGRWVVSLNGEIYNYKELRSTLEKNLKTQFVGSSDTEVVLEYVAAYGIRKALAEFKGMFAIAILDIQNRKLFLVRDRAGEKPVFYYIDESEIAFASELPALLKLVSTSPKICRHSLAQFLRFNFIPAPNTIYEGIKKLLPGQMLEISIESDRFLKQFDTYWSAETEFKQRQLRKSEDTYEDQLTRFATLFRDSVKGQLQADVPVGAFLSGGIDSSAVVVEMAKLSSQKIRTYTIGFVESEYDESPYARRLSEFLSTQHEHQILCAEDALAIVPHLSETFGEPFGDASAIPTMLVSKMASKSVKVALSGDGGDELFGGYPHYTTVGGVWPKISKFPHWSRSIIAELLPLVPTPGWRVAEVILKKIAGQQALRRPLSETWRGLQSLLNSKNESRLCSRPILFDRCSH
jgi:asparagine synthase (glutamine-hydrolysing)